MQSLGHLLWFTIERAGEGEPSTVLTREDVAGWFADAGLDVALLPPAATSVEAFRFASNLTRTYTEGGILFTLTVHESSADDRRVVREVVCTFTSGRTSRRVKMAELVFTRPRVRRGVQVPGTEGWRHQISPASAPPGSTHRREVQALVDDFSGLYASHNRGIPIDAVRRAYYATLEQADGVLVRPSGGVWFVPHEHAHLVRGLAQVTLALGAPSFLHTVPVPDTPEQRAMVEGCFNDEIRRDCSRLRARLGQTPTAERTAVIRQDVDDVVDRLGRHQLLLPEADVTPALVAVEDLLRDLDG